MESASTHATQLADQRAAGEAALVIVDMISAWDFPDADEVLEQAMPLGSAIAVLAARCRSSGVPVIYANDNHGRWRSDFRQVVSAALEAGGQGASITRQLTPQRDDYFVLKPKHSAFRATPLDLLLRHLGARRLILTGVSSDQCILYSAADARMLDYEVIVPCDCVATRDGARNAAALRHLREVLRLRTPESASLDLPPS